MFGSRDQQAGTSRHPEWRRICQQTVLILGKSIYRFLRDYSRGSSVSRRDRSGVLMSTDG
jgi:hypothetical protein